MTMVHQRRLILATYFVSCVTVAHGFVVVDSRILLDARQSLKRPHQGGPFYSLPSQQQQQQQQESFLLEHSEGRDSILTDIMSLVMFSFWCLTVAFLVCIYQDFDVSHMKPQGILRDQALYGLAYKNDENSIHPSYNTVLQHHRDVRLKMWKNQKISKNDAVTTIIRSLESIQQLKRMANDYEWDDMQTTLRQPLLTSQLEEACTVLRKTAISPEARDEIGFDWGSCAWRHCGAQADAQEALAELYNLIGVLEPFECLFCLDIIERALQDVLAVSNVEAAEFDIPVYTPYEARGQEDGESALDIDFLKALNGFRSRIE
jgi:hypothetical protein